MRVLLLDSAYPINTRNIKILNSIKKHTTHCDVTICTWNRDGREISDNDKFNYETFNRKAQYGNPFKKLIQMFSYYKFLKKCNDKIKPTIIIASHWDMLILAFFFKLKYQKLIYEILDIPTASFSLVQNTLNFIERKCLSKTDALIFASRFYCDLYKDFTGKKIVLENLPLESNVSNIIKYQYVSDKFKISFIGKLRYFSVMKNLIDAVDNLDVEILFWGEGPDYNALKEYSEGNSQIKFFGKYDYDYISDIYNLSDLVWAVYPSLDYNVKYAISNKYYECVKFKVPGIFAKNTHLGDFVDKEKIGYTVNPYSVADIKSLFQDILINKEKNLSVKNNLLLSKENKSWENNEHILIDLINNV